MRRQHPDPQMSIPITLAKYHQLLGASNNTGYEKEDWEIAAEAIDEWLRRHDPDTMPLPATKGYQWKSLFLPDGTLLRTVFGGKNYHCLIEGDKVLYNSQPVSPSSFVNAVGGIRRNAWRCTWVLFPDTKEWKLADTLRLPKRPRRQRKPVPDFHAPAPQPPAPQPSAPQPPAPIASVGAPPIPGPIRVQVETVAPSASDAPCSHSANHDNVPQTSLSSHANNPQQRTSTTVSPPPRDRGADRRSGAANRMAALMQEELLPLLYRMCACERARPVTQG